MPTINNAYLKNPSIKGDHLIFCTDDDLWLSSIRGGVARRITNATGTCQTPFINPKEESVAYISNDDGQNEIYIQNIYGGEKSKLTSIGVNKISGWKDSKTIIFSSSSLTFSPRVTFLYELNIETKKVAPLNLGHASCLNFNGQKRLLGRNIGDPARWKRYRGGTAGTLWLDNHGNDDFKKLLPKLKTNIANPLWIKDKIYFISDHEGIGNIYSVTSNGKVIQRHTHSQNYYVRSFSSDGNNICYQAGAELYLLSVDSNKEKRIEIRVPSSFNQSSTRLEDAEQYLQEYTIRSDSKELAFVSRGQLFHRSPWKGAPRRKGQDFRRYKHPTFIEENNEKDKTISHKLLSIELNEEGEETLTLFNLDNRKSDEHGKKIADDYDFGKIYEIKPNPRKFIIALSNNRNDLFLVNLKTGKINVIDNSKYFHFFQFSWSPCGQYLAYSKATSHTKKSLHLYDFRTDKSRTLIDSVIEDTCPTFSPDGEFLYFIGIRRLHPIYNETHFDLSFPFANEVFSINLQEDLPSPMDMYLEFDNEEDNDDDESNEEDGKKQKNKKGKVQSKDDDKSKNDTIKIDWNGIENRILRVPIPMGGIHKIASSQDKIFILKHNITNKDGDPLSDLSPKSSVYTYCFKEKKYELFQRGCSNFEISKDRQFILMYTEDGLRLCSTECKPSDGSEHNKKDGFISLDNIQVHINPKKEWRQMYDESWVLQRENFWVADLNKVDWEKVYHDYLPLLNKVHTRSEFSDLMWEMQGELGTSHCYEFGGDYFRKPFPHRQGDLAAELSWNEKSKILTIKNIAKGDSWIPQACSPLLYPGVNLKTGDQILGCEGRMFKEQNDLSKALEARTGEKLSLTILRKGKKESEIVEITPIKSGHLARYRDWVEENKRIVAKLSNNKLGYVHIPDMGIHGFSEFYRNFLTQYSKEGLVVDIRYNGGGHVSQHILKILAQKTLGFDKTRHMGIETYPAYSINGPIVAITNEHAGSDGDIFSHSFKLMNIGKLIGMRTWGGVVGIWPRFSLNDGSGTSQPEFSYWFKDVGYNVENYGTDPDIEVDKLPIDWKKGKDPQIERAVQEILKERRSNPPLKPDLNKKRPSLKAPKLPKQ